MSLKSLECKLAQGQLSRFLSGEGISTEMIRQLEGHIEECEDCRTLIAERKRALEQVVVSARAVVEVEVEDDEEIVVDKATPKATAKNARTPRFDLLTRKLTERAADSKGFKKPVVLSSALAVLLVAMSYIAKDPTSLLGKKLGAEASMVSAPVDNLPQQPLTPPASPIPGKEVAAESKPVELPSPTVVIKPPVSVLVATPKRIVKQPRKRKAAPRPTSTAIRVYDATGQPLTGGN